LPSGPPQVYAAGEGISDADVMVYVFSVATPRCSDGVVAYAAACQWDQFNRPVLGAINVCPHQIDVNDHSGQLRVMMHELGHLLGVNSSASRDWNGYGSMAHTHTSMARYSYLPTRLIAELGS
jgi:hypothetical protein